MTATDWDHCVNADLLTDYFTDLDYLLTRVPADVRHHIYAVIRSPQHEVRDWDPGDRFEFVGYDLIDRRGGPSALSNCGGFPDLFQADDLSEDGLLRSFQQAQQVQADLKRLYPEEPHANCDIWAIWLREC